MIGTKILTFITIVLIAITLSCIPALAAGLEYTKTLLYFYVNAFDEVTVTLVGSTGETTAASPGTQTSDTLNFTCGTPTCPWLNVTTSLGGTQTDISPGINIKNTGSSNAQINISVNASLPGGGVSSCLDLKYENETWDGDAEANAVDLSTANITLVNATSFVHNEDLDVWLFGNFTDCQAQTTLLQFYVWAMFS